MNSSAITMASSCSQQSAALRGGGWSVGHRVGDDRGGSNPFLSLDASALVTAASASSTAARLRQQSEDAEGVVASDRHDSVGYGRDAVVVPGHGLPASRRKLHQGV